MSRYSAEHPSKINFHTRRWTCDNPLATVVFVHGYAEHIERYDHVFSKIAAANINVFGFDGRGFGRTATKETAGVTGGWSVQLNDIDHFITQERQRNPELPLFLWGHSMGGALVLKYGIDGAHRDQLVGIISMAPLIDQHPSSKANSIVARLGSMAAKLMPDKQISVQVSSQNISRDPIEREKYDKDEFVRPFGSLKGVADMLGEGPSLLLTSNASRLVLPLLLLHGTGDRVTYHKSSAEFFKLVKSADKTFLEYPGFYHELHNEPEPDRTKVIEDCRDWILARCRQSPIAKL